MPEQGKILVPQQGPTPEPDKDAHQPAELDFSQAEYKRFYANHVMATMSLFEIRVVFNSVQGIDPQSNKLVVDETMSVRMAPELAAALLATLQRNLNDYVRLFGNLRPTKTLTTQDSQGESKTEPPPQPAVNL